MAGTNAFRDYLAAAASTGTCVAFSPANARIGVGDSATAFAAANTDLVAASNKLRKACTTATLEGNVFTFVSTFSTAEANWAWNEWGVFNAASAGTMMQRKVEALGTKTSAQTWQITATITLGIA